MVYKKEQTIHKKNVKQGTIKKEINQIKSMALDDLKISNNLLKEAPKPSF